jgi:hypothetical protein
LVAQVQRLSATVDNLIQAQNENVKGIHKAFAMSDVHQQVLQRVARDLTIAMIGVRKLSVDGSVDFHLADFAPLKLHEQDGVLDLSAYYKEYRELGEAAGQEFADLALIIWSQGQSPEEALERAKLEQTRRAASKVTSDQDEDYETEFFGGTNGQSHHQQESQAAHANG